MLIKVREEDAKAMAQLMGTAAIKQADLQSTYKRTIEEQQEQIDNFRQELSSLSAYRDKKIIMEALMKKLTEEKETYQLQIEFEVSQ